MKIVQLLIAICLLTFSINMEAQTNVQSKEDFLKRSKYLLDSGGVWLAMNPKYDSTQEWSATSFGYKFEEGYHENFIKIKINGTMKGKKYLFWDGYYFWDPVKQRASYFSMGTGGALARGEVINTDHDLYFTLVNPDRTETIHLDTDTIISPNEFQSQSYKLENGEWKTDNKLTWKRIISK